MRYSWELRSAKRSQDICCPGVILEFCTDRFSPITKAQQYLRYLFAGPNNPRKFAIALYAGFSTSGEFCSSKHPLYMRFRSAVFATSAWLWARFHKYKEPKWLLAKAHDPRLTVSERADARDSFMGYSSCCLDPGCSRKLRKGQVLVSADVNSAAMTAIGQEIARIWPNNNACECQRARNQRHNTQQSAWETLAADHILAEQNAASEQASATLSQCSLALQPAETTSQSPAQMEDISGTNREDTVSEVEHIGGTNERLVMHQMLLRRYKKEKRKVAPQMIWNEIDPALGRLSPEQRAVVVGIGKRTAEKKTSR